MRDGQDDTVFLGLSCTHELPLLVYPGIQVNVDDPLHVAFEGQDVHVPFCSQNPDLQVTESEPSQTAPAGQGEHLLSLKR